MFCLGTGHLLYNMFMGLEGQHSHQSFFFFIVFSTLVLYLLILTYSQRSGPVLLILYLKCGFYRISFSRTLSPFRSFPRLWMSICRLQHIHFSSERAPLLHGIRPISRTGVWRMPTNGWAIGGGNTWVLMDPLLLPIIGPATL